MSATIHNEVNLSPARYATASATSTSRRYATEVGEQGRAPSEPGDIFGPKREVVEDPLAILNDLPPRSLLDFMKYEPMDLDELQSPPPKEIESEYAEEAPPKSVDFVA